MKVFSRVNEYAQGPDTTIIFTAMGFEIVFYSLTCNFLQLFSVLCLFFSPPLLISERPVLFHCMFLSPLGVNVCIWVRVHVVGLSVLYMLLFPHVGVFHFTGPATYDGSPSVESPVFINVITYVGRPMITQAYRNDVCTFVSLPSNRSFDFSL